MSKSFVVIIVGLLLLFLLMFYLGQGQMIYFPRDYAAKAPELDAVTAHSYSSNGTKQWVYLSKRDQTTGTDWIPPDRIWWMFGGNGALALDWVSLVVQADPSVNQVFVLFEYPGYGFNSGRPSPETIFQSVDDSMAMVAEQVGLSVDEVKERSIGLGHSLGAAVALDAANRHGWEEVVAISPFTTMEAMARKQVGGFLAGLLRHHYDNEVSLDAIIAREGEPKVDIFHGEADNLIPFSMGRSLAERDNSGRSVEFLPVPNAGHNDIIWRLEGELLKRFNRP